MPAEKKKAPPDFEQARERLEAIAEAMESEEPIALSELVAKYEEGINLHTTCMRYLRDAELKIEKLKATRETETFDEPAEEPDA